MSLRDLVDGLRAERRKGLFFTDQGWQSCNQSEWAAIAAPADGLCRLELIDARPLYAQTIDDELKGMAPDTVRPTQTPTQRRS